MIVGIGQGGTVALALTRPRVVEAALAVSTVQPDEVKELRPAWYAIRARLDADLGQLPSAEALVFTSPDGTLAAVAAADRSAADGSVMALEGGTDAWVAAGLPLETGASNMASAAEDIRLRAREQDGEIEAAMRAYLAWEIELVNDMAKDDDHRFNVIAPPT